MKYTITIRWSEEDKCFVVYLPEFQYLVMQPVTHGDTYEKALTNAKEVLEVFVKVYQEEGRLPSVPLQIAS